MNGLLYVFHPPHLDKRRVDVGDAHDGELAGGLVLLEGGLDDLQGFLLLALVDAEQADGGGGQAQLLADQLHGLLVRVGGQVDDGRVREEGLEAVRGHPRRVVLVQRQPAQLHQA